MSVDKMSKKPGRPKKEQVGDTKENILQTASFLFMEHGYEKISMEQVAEACNVTKASVYYYFKNKAMLFAMAIASMMQRIQQRTDMILQDGENLKEKLYTITVHRLRVPHIDFETLMREATPSLTEEHVKQIREAEASIHHSLEAVFQQAMEEGEIKTKNPLLLSHMFATVTMISNKEQLMKELGGPEKAAEELVDLFWNGIAKE